MNCLLSPTLRLFLGPFNISKFTYKCDNMRDDKFPLSLHLMACPSALHSICAFVTSVRVDSHEAPVNKIFTFTWIESTMGTSQCIFWESTFYLLLVGVIELHYWGQNDEALENRCLVELILITVLVTIQH